MKIINLINTIAVYTSNVYLVLGSWNTMQDLNTLVDTGRDPSVFEAIEKAHTGVGKRKVDQVVLTHSHYDHTNNLSTIKSRYSPKVYAYSRYMSDIDEILFNNQELIMGDSRFRVIHTPGHTGDSVCFFCPVEGVLFSGDTSISMNIKEDGRRVVIAGEVAIDGVRIIYPGHGDPIKVG